MRSGTRTAPAWFLLPLGVLLLLALAGPLLERPFLLRVGAFAALLLVALPWLARGPLRAILDNLFDLDFGWQVALVIAAAASAALAAVRVLAVAWGYAACRFGGEAPAGAAADALTPGLPQYLLALLVALPIVWTALRRSPEARFWGGLAGAGLVAVIFGWNAATGALLRRLVPGTAAECDGAAAPLLRGYVAGGSPLPGHLETVGFLLVMLAIYAWGYRALEPRGGRQVPALCFVLTVVAALTLLAGGIAFQFDLYRVPVSLLLALLAVGGYLLFGVDHFYPVLAEPPSAPAEADLAALRARLARQPAGAGRTLVVVCAAGGGIQAAAWTARVLTGLRERLGSEFAEAVAMVSGASGGSVGAMYWLDGFGADGAPPDDPSRVRRAAERNGLDAVGWGLAYPDLWRLLGAPRAAPRLQDRGSALERDWDAELRRPGATLGEWGERALAGALPLPVFNAVLVESGRRLLLTPFDLHDRREAVHAAAFHEGDVGVATAARLSATFPYVSPVARPDRGRRPHVADGGYFDNTGVFTALNWLAGRVRPNAAVLGIERVFVIEIRAFPDDASDAPGGAPPGPGWLMLTLGPLRALLGVRRSSQAARNAAEAAALAALWSDARGSVLRYVPLVLPTPEVAPPLSWKLNRAQRRAIEAGWRELERSDAFAAFADDWRSWRRGGR